MKANIALDYMDGLKKAYIMRGKKKEWNDFEKVMEGACESDIAALKEVYPNAPNSLIELLKIVDGTYWREYQGKEITFYLLGSDIEEYPYYLLSAKQIVETQNEAYDYYADYVNREFEPEDIPIDERIIDDAEKMQWLHFSDCMNNGGTSQLFIDFSPSDKGVIGQVVRFLHDPDEIEVIADSFDEYLQMLMDGEYNFISEEDMISEIEEITDAENGGIKMSEQMKEALEALREEGETDLYEEIIRKQDIKEPAFAEAALEHGIFHPATLYKDASPQVCDQLITLLEEEENTTLNIDGILLALAAIGDEVVLDAFKRWEENPPAWREKLYVGPSTYAMEGGWCIEDGEKKELLYNNSYELQRVEACDAGQNVYGGPAEDRCPHCDSKYVDILVLDGRDARLAFLGIEGRIKIKTCISCLPWEEYILCKYEEDGESKVIGQESGFGDRIDDEDYDTEKCCVISKAPIAKHYCSEWEGSAVGGVPTYVNDAHYVDCPECGKKMKHLAQLGGEYTGYGNIYVQICKACKTAATFYQQS